MSAPTGGQWRPARGGPISVKIPVEDLSRVGEARRAADSLARSCGLDQTARDELAIVVTEAATNLARHATEGLLFLRGTEPTGIVGVEVLAVDRGPGMADVTRNFTDGYSTGGTPGTGLGAIQRLSSELDLFSARGTGTVLVARVFCTTAKAAAPRDRLVDVGVVCRPLEPEQVCGDGWIIDQHAGRAVLLVVDGLGHGPSAAEAADVARDVFCTVSSRRPQEILVAVHDAMRTTRGGAVAVAELTASPQGATVTLSGAGNVNAAVITHAGAKSLPSMNGTVGLQLRAMREFTAELPADGQLVLHTDGVTARWRLDAYPGLLHRDPALVAAVLHRDFSRGRDDATVVALKLRAGPSR